MTVIRLIPLWGRFLGSIELEIVLLTYSLFGYKEGVPYKVDSTQLRRFATAFFEEGGEFRQL